MNENTFKLNIIIALIFVCLGIIDIEPFLFGMGWGIGTISFVNKCYPIPDNFLSGEKDQ